MSEKELNGKEGCIGRWKGRCLHQRNAVRRTVGGG